MCTIDSHLWYLDILFIPCCCVNCNNIIYNRNNNFSFLKTTTIKQQHNNSKQNILLRVSFDSSTYNIKQQSSNYCNCQNNAYNHSQPHIGVWNRVLIFLAHTYNGEQTQVYVYSSGILKVHSYNHFNTNTYQLKPYFNTLISSNHIVIHFSFQSIL